MKRKFTPDFNTALGIAEKYELNDNADKLRAALAEIPDFKVTAPVIGGFSTGKSSLINAVIGEELLSTNITPETAVPTEITYGDDTVTLVSGSGAEKFVPLSDFDSKQLAAEKYSVVRIRSSNAFFEQIPSIKLVDMPGFDSGIDVHNKAIDNYLPASLAYILTVAADEGTLRASIISFLNELKLYDMPVYTVITKAGKVDPAVIEQLKAHITETLRRFLKIDDPKVAVTTAKGRAGTVDVSGFKDFLMELQSNSDDIFNRYFSAKLIGECTDVEKYLSDRLSHGDMSLEEIELQKEQLEHNISELSSQLEREKSSFSRQISTCISDIGASINNSLNASRSLIESLILQGGDVGGKINSLIRSAVASAMQSDVEPRIRRYVQRVSEMINAEIYGADQVIQTQDTGIDEKELTTSVKGVVVPIVTTVATSALTTLAGTTLASTLGLTGSMMGPIGAAIGALAGMLISSAISAGMKQKKEEERKELARQKAGEIIASASADARSKVEAKIMEYIAELNNSIDDDVDQKRALLEKSLADTEEKLRQGKAEMEQEKAALAADLDTIRRIKNGN